MKRSDEQEHDMVRWKRIGDTYNVPAETPREEMWDVISARIDGLGPAAPRDADGGVERGGDSNRAADVHDLTAARRRSQARARASGPSVPLSRAAGWAVAAAAVLVLGIGRMSAPGPVATGLAPGSATARGGVSWAARDYLGRTESLLTMVQADARDGRVDPVVAEWAEDLLMQTRLLLDRPDSVEPDVRDLLMDLELVLVQVVGAAQAGPSSDARARTETELTLKSLSEGAVLPRIQAVLPDGMAGA